MRWRAQVTGGATASPAALSDEAAVTGKYYVNVTSNLTGITYKIGLMTPKAGMIGAEAPQLVRNLSNGEWGLLTDSLFRSQIDGNMSPPFHGAGDYKMEYYSEENQRYMRYDVPYWEQYTGNRLSPDTTPEKINATFKYNFGDCVEGGDSLFNMFKSDILTYIASNPYYWLNTPEDHTFGYTVEGGKNFSITAAMFYVGQFSDPDNWAKYTVVQEPNGYDYLNAAAFNNLGFWRYIQFQISPVRDFVTRWGNPHYHGAPYDPQTYHDDETGFVYMDPPDCYLFHNVDGTIGLASNARNWGSDSPAQAPDSTSMGTWWPRILYTGFEPGSVVVHNNPAWNSAGNIIQYRIPGWATYRRK